MQLYVYSPRTVSHAACFNQSVSLPIPESEHCFPLCVKLNGSSFVAAEWWRMNTEIGLTITIICHCPWNAVMLQPLLLEVSCEVSVLLLNSLNFVHSFASIGRLLWMLLGEHTSCWLSGHVLNSYSGGTKVRISAGAPAITTENCDFPQSL
jgi:hypothetical protein